MLISRYRRLYGSMNVAAMTARYYQMDLRRWIVPLIGTLSSITRYGRFNNLIGKQRQ
jgi:hypothetical protein